MQKRIALCQMCSGIDPIDNAAKLRAYIRDAQAGGADILFTPEMTGMMDRDRMRAKATIRSEADDIVLKAACEAAAAANISVLIGSLAIRHLADDEDLWVNRSYLIDQNGKIAAKYDKIHLFDVDLGPGQSYRESAAFQGGQQAVVARFGETNIGLSVCYDIRFASLYTSLTNAGANILSIPAAFTVPTGRAHWEILLRARAIESGAFVIAAAQCGDHDDGRSTHGHSMIVDPWGNVMLDMEREIGLGFYDIDLSAVAQARSRIPAIANRRTFLDPQERP
ncbi:nitrilase [Sphingomonadales bacterium EhC05]|jgi:predicted amidohydrolase|nr:nitrilase [Sphingomonadales bacterium EhC05]